LLLSALVYYHPELLNGTFNRGNQADGTRQQALAGSVAAFAATLVNTPDHLDLEHAHVSGHLAVARRRSVGDPG